MMRGNLAPTRPWAAAWHRCYRWLALTIVIGATALGCSNYHHRAYRLGEPQVQEPTYTLNFVEADDEGWFWDPSQAFSALKSVETSAASSDTIVLVYVPGWHHNAAEGDDNVEGFKLVLNTLESELRNKMFSSAREEVHKVTKAANAFRVIGIYIGWRGGSLPGYLDYLTFWGRKSAAKRVGETDLSEFMARLQNVYKSHNAADPHTPTSATYLGLVTIGHSFGSQVVIRAVSRSLERGLEDLGPAPTYLRQTDVAPTVTLDAPVQGYGDLLLLVNPAVEAAAYERLRMLSQRFTYAPTQTPLILTLSADNDKPRHKLFEWGRVVGEFFTSTPYKADPRERNMERQALGVYDKGGTQDTHTLTPVDPNVKLVSTPGHCHCEYYTWATPPTQVKDDSLPSNVDIQQMPELKTIIGKYDFSSPTVFANITLQPLRNNDPYQPMILATVPKTIIDGHNGMFSQPLIDFMTKYIGFIEAKRYLITANEKRWTTPH